VKLSPGFYTFVGLKNYLLLLKDQRIKESFVKILSWTLIWALATVFLTFTLGLLLALALNQKKLMGKAIYRVLLIIPYSIPFFISVLIFKGLLNKDFGIINEFLSYFGMAKTDWLTDPFNAKISALLVNLWLGFPYMFLLITGILQSIPETVYEAAKMDGAGRFTTLKSITLPMVFSAIAPLLVGSFAFNLNNFVGIYLLTGGGPAMQNSITPAGETDILISYTYKLAFEGGQGQDFGMASSIALFIFIIITILTLINFKLSGMFKKDR
jgi:ABC-type sugar transport system permease subunit